MRFLYHWLPVAIWMGVIYKLSSRTGEDMDGWLAIIHRWIPSMQGFDWGHFVAYYILGLAFAWAIAGSTLTWSRTLIVVLLCILYGVTDEYHQSFVPGRTPDLADIRNDGIGAALAMLTLRVPVVRRTMERLHGVKYY